MFLIISVTMFLHEKSFNELKIKNNFNKKLFKMITNCYEKSSNIGILSMKSEIYVRTYVSNTT